MKFTNDMIFDSHDKCRQGMNGSKMRSIRGWGIGGMNEFLTSLEQVSLDEGCCHTWPNICKNLCHLLCVVYVSTANAGAHTLYLRQSLSLLPIFITGRYISPHHYSNGTKTIRVTRVLHESQGQRCAPRFILFLSLHHIPRIPSTLNPTLS